MPVEEPFPLASTTEVCSRVGALECRNDCQRPLAYPKKRDDCARHCDTPASDLPRRFACEPDYSEQRPYTDDYQYLAKLNAQIKGQQALPYARRIDLQNFVQNK